MTITPPVREHDARPVPTKPSRLAPIAGLIFAVLMVASIASSGGDTPDFGAPLEEWKKFAEENSDNLRLSVVLFGPAVLAFGLFLRGLANRLDCPGSDTTAIVVGGFVGVTGILIGLVLSAVATVHTDTSPDVIRAINDTAGAGFTIAAPAFALMMITVFLLGRETKGIPSWLSYVALACGVAFILQLGTLLSDEFDNAFGAFYPIAFLLLLIFTIGASVVGLRRVKSDR